MTACARSLALLALVASAAAETVEERMARRAENHKEVRLLEDPRWQELKGFHEGSRGHGTCRLLSAAWESPKEQRLEGYGYKPDPEWDFDETTQAPTCGLPVFDHASLNRSFLLQAKEPFFIRGATESWAAHQKWDLEGLRREYNASVFHADALETRTVGALLSEGGYYNGQMGFPNDCYGFPEFDPTRPKPPTLSVFERQYSPFIAAAAGDYEVPAYLLPARALYMSIGGRTPGTGAIPEEHPSAWFAAVKGRKRWVLHPRNRNGPRNFMINRGNGCPVQPVTYTTTRVCDQREGDIIWLPSGYWHETCNLDNFSSGLGGITYAEVDKPRAKAGKCNLGRHREANRLIRQHINSDMYNLKMVPYCQEGNSCPTLSANYVKKRDLGQCKEPRRSPVIPETH